MSLVPEVKRRSGFDPHQPRDRKGRWVETGAEVRNSITHAIGTVSRIVRGDAFHENRYEVRTSDGQTQTWETSAVDVVRNRDGSAPSEHAPGSAPNRPAAAHPGATHPGGSRAADAIGQVYAGQAPGKPQAGHSPVDHAVDAVYGQPHPDRPGRVADAVNSVYAAQAPNKPEAGRTPVAHAVDAAHGTPAAPPPGGGFRGQLDDRWHKGGTVIHPHTTLAKLKPGDRIHTEGQGTQASPVTLAKPNPSNGVIPGDRRKTRTVAHVQRNPDSTHTVHFTDGTSTGTEGGSNIPVSDTGRSRVYAADAPDAIVAGGGTPPPPAPGPDVTPPPVNPPDVTPPTPDGGAPSGVQVPEMTGYRDAAQFITDQIGDPAIGRDLQILLSGRMNRNRNPIAIETDLANHPEAERIQAMVALVQRGHPRATTWDGQVVRDGLQRYVNGDPTLPANAIGSSVGIDVRDTRPGVVIRLGPNASTPTRHVNGIITDVTPVRGQSGQVYIRLRDDAGDYHFETYPADMHLDVTEAAPQTGPLAAEVRDVRRSMLDMPGMAANDRIYQATTLQSLVGGNVSATEAHTRVDLVRNNVIDNTDGSERADAMAALDRLDTAIDAHAGPTPAPPARLPMPTVDQLDQAIGDLGPEDVPDMTTPEILGHIDRLDPLVNGWIQNNGSRSNPFFVQAVDTLDALESERGNRDDIPVDPGGTTALFGDGADAPEVPQGDPVPASDLSVGDQISYVTADGITVSGQIEGLHTAGPNVVATLRMPDDSRDTHAFKRDAEVVRTAGAPEPPTEDTAAGDLRMGHRILLPDVTGAYRAATVISKTKDPGGTGLVLEVARDDGTHETVIVDPAEMLPRITDRTTPPEPDLPPMPDPTPDDGTKLVTALQPGDRIASYGDNVTVVRARVAADGLVHARVRLANGAEDDVTYAPDAVVTLADPPSVIRHDPLPVDTASVRPVLYTYQRNGITALNLDATDSGQPPLVQQAAARVRARQALSEEQSAALADALRAQANAPGVRAPRQRTLSRQAAALDAAAAAAGGRVPPVTPNRDTVEKTRPNNLVPGDWVALRSQGTGGGVDVVQVLDSRPMMGGRLHELSVRDQEGNETRRLVAGNADTYLLPDLPRDLPAPPEQPRPEHISVDRLNMGDTIRFTHVDPNTYASTVREGKVTGIATMGGEGSKIVGIHVDVNGSDYMFRQRTNAPGGPNVLVRTARGDASQDQPYDSLLPAENPEVLRSVTDVAVGDRVSVPAVAGVPHVGVVHDIEKVASDDGASGVRMQLRQDDGTVSTVVIFNDDPAKVTRLAKGDEGAAQRIQQMYAERERQLLANAARRKIESFRSQLLTYEVRPNPAGSPEDAAAGVLRGRDDPGAMAQRNIRDSAHEIAGYLSPDTTDEAQRALIASRIEPILRQVREEYLTNLADSLRQVPPDQAGYGNYGWTQRVIDQHKQSPSTRDFGRIARTLADAAANLQGGGDNQAMPVVNVPEGSGDLRTRIAAYKAALPGGDAFGKRQVTRTTFKQPTLDDLEAGRVPDTETATTFAPDRAADGGPGETAMAHHDVILAAGRDLQGELNRRMVARDASFGSDPEATLATLKAQRDEAGKASSAALNAYYGSMSVDPSNADQRAELRAAYDAASARSKEINDRYQAMTLRLARLRREVAMEIVADHRQTGGVRIDWVDNKGKVLTDRSQLVKAMRQAEDVYPTEWLQRFKDRTKGRFTLKSVKRGYFAEGRGEIALSDKAVKMEGGGNKDDVAVHELGHGMEWVVPGLTAAEEALLWARTSDGPVGSRTRQKKTTIYKGEYGWKDEFPEHYTGKDYGGGFHEVFTMTVESVFAGSSYADANLTQWLLGSMVLL